MVNFLQNISLVIGIFGALFGIAGAIAAIYFAQQSNTLNQELAKQTAVTTMDLKVKNPPPYKSENEYSEVTIKNVGQRVSGNSLRVILICSWADEIEYTLKFPSPNWTIQPNEEYRWKIRLGYSGNLAGAKITIKAFDKGLSWENSERII